MHIPLFSILRIVLIRLIADNKYNGDWTLNDNKLPAVKVEAIDKPTLSLRHAPCHHVPQQLMHRQHQAVIPIQLKQIRFG